MRGMTSWIIVKHVICGKRFIYSGGVKTVDKKVVMLDKSSPSMTIRDFMS